MLLTIEAASSIENVATAGVFLLFSALLRGSVDSLFVGRVHMTTVRNSSTAAAAAPLNRKLHSPPLLC